MFTLKIDTENAAFARSPTIWSKGDTTPGGFERPSCRIPAAGPFVVFLKGVVSNHDSIRHIRARSRVGTS